ncbi:tetratricopeptide repeat protein [Solwaraspora sp. WMMD791]|uniref:ATP-binding protein n=1 Tax=Solwaraspora sp. WMMD791 TaxID=3016086 RepID=UPI00249A5404|nr:tetratricopeptide repeat protein [Solwaraspora sp. WMMD791]WFE30268.1 tetratricopeptide repeat protein [Solwaraspora sp. WMMD791]
MADGVDRPGTDPGALDPSAVRTVAELAQVLRALRRRHARRRHDGELTYRALAARTGWSTAAVAEYLTGQTLPPTDRFDVLVALLGATPAEQGALATARDRVAEHHRRAPRTAGRARPAVVPRQLPADVYAFTGRDAQLDRLDTLLAGADQVGTATVVSVITGTAGVGKTSLAVHWAHRATDRFPDGQLYLDLRGHDPGLPVSAADALARLLASTGVPQAEIPVEVEQRAARYRTQLAGRRMLVLLDNAGTAEQVRPLLPGGSSCAVLVTSRDSLAGLVARDGARRVDLDPLPLDDAVALLGQLIGPRAAAEPDAVAQLARLCARLPLALRIVAERAGTHPAGPLATLVAELADRHRRLELMDSGDDPHAAVSAVFSWSVRHLPAATARTFRLLGLHPGPDFDGYAAAALAGADLAAARRDLAALARAHLVQPVGADRYALHDLLAAYAAQLADAEESEAARRAARSRLFDLQLAALSAAIDLLHPVDRRKHPVPEPETAVPELTDAAAARAWLDAERPALVAAAGYAVTNGWPAHAVNVSTAIYRFLEGGHFADALAVHGHAARAAEVTGDETGHAHALVDLGSTYLALSRFDLAAEHFRQALARYERTGDLTGQARALADLGKLERRRGRHELATGYIRRALAVAEASGDGIGHVRALMDLGFVETERGRYDVAVAHHRQALALAGRLGHRLGEAAALVNVGLVELRANRHAEAIAHLSDALDTFRQMGHRTGEAAALSHLGNALTSIGEPEQAVARLTAAQTIVCDSGDREGQAWVLNGLGEAAYASGRPAEALTRHSEALAIAVDIDVHEPQARAHRGLGRAYAALGDLAQARHHLTLAVDRYRRLRSREADQVQELLSALDLG